MSEWRCVKPGLWRRSTGETLALRQGTLRRRHGWYLLRDSERPDFTTSEWVAAHHASAMAIIDRRHAPVTSPAGLGAPVGGDAA